MTLKAILGGHAANQSLKLSPDRRGGVLTLSSMRRRRHRVRLIRQLHPHQALTIMLTSSESASAFRGARIRRDEQRVRELAGASAEKWDMDA